MSSDESPLFSQELTDFINLCLEVVQNANGEFLTNVMSPEEFWKLGYLQESNRRFFHPLGLALTAQIDGDSGEIKLGQILDGRHDPEGIRFSPGMASIAKVKNVDQEWNKRTEIRMKSLGYMIQPIEQLIK